MSGIIEYEDDLLRVLFLDGYRLGPRFPREGVGNDAYVKVPGRKIETGVFHHTAGGFYDGIEAVDRLANYCIAEPKYAKNLDGTLKLDAKGRKIHVGGGRGWPGIPYTYVIPARPASEGGRLVVYKIWHDDWITGHTGGVYNRHGVGVCIGGWYASRHDLLSGAKDSPSLERPTEEAMVCADRLVDYLMDRHELRLGVDTLKCHAELGKPACPGAFVENWIRTRRGEDPIIDPTPGHEDGRALTTTRQVQLALVELGFDPGTIDGDMGPFTANAVRAFQRAEKLRPDGIFGPITLRAMRLALARPR